MKVESRLRWSCLREKSLPGSHNSLPTRQNYLDLGANFFLMQPHDKQRRLNFLDHVVTYTVVIFSLFKNGFLGFDESCRGAGYAFNIE